MTSMRPTVRRRRLGVPLAVAALAVVAVACAGSSSPTATSPAGPATTRPAIPVDFSKPGPYKVGTLTVDLPDRQAVVYYPADPAAAAKAEKVTGYSTAVAFPEQLRAAVPPEFIQNVSLEAYKAPKASPEGPFPVVLHSHGAGGYYLFESRHYAHLASWGFVVAAPDHKERSLGGSLAGGAGGAGATVAANAVSQDVVDLRDTKAALTEANSAADSPLRGALALDQMAAEGHSAGGRAAALVADDPAIKTFIGMAPAPPIPFTSADRDASAEERAARTKAALADQTPPAKPSMLIASDNDQIIPLALVKPEYDWLAQPKALAVLRNAGHNAYTDLCPPIRERGGLSQYGDRLPALKPLFRLGEDGCLPTNLDPDKGYALINQLTVAQLRWVFGIDPTRASLDPEYLRKTFPDALASFDYQGGPTP